MKVDVIAPQTDGQWIVRVRVGRRYLRLEVGSEADAEAVQRFLKPPPGMPPPPQVTQWLDECFQQQTLLTLPQHEADGACRSEVDQAAAWRAFCKEQCQLPPLRHVLTGGMGQGPQGDTMDGDESDQCKRRRLQPQPLRRISSETLARRHGRAIWTRGKTFTAWEQVGDPLGKGGFGCVYRARDLSNGQLFAVKVLFGEHDDTMQERFMAHVELMRNLDCGTVKVLGGEVREDGKLLLFMELHEGCSLAEFMKALMVGAVPVSASGCSMQVPEASGGSASHSNTQPTIMLSAFELWSELRQEAAPHVRSNTVTYARGYMSWALKHGIAKAVVLAVSRLHGANLVHRDIKPENILVTTWADDGAPGGIAVEAKLADLDGLAEDSGFDAATLGLVPGDGTFAFEAPEVRCPPPEQAKAALRKTKEADIWSLGVVLLRLFTGLCPSPTRNFLKDPKYDNYQKLQYVMDPTITKVGIVGLLAHWSMPQQAKDLLSSCLQLDPAKRLGAAALLEQHPFFLASTQELASWEMLPLAAAGDKELNG